MLTRKLLPTVLTVTVGAAGAVLSNHVLGGGSAGAAYTPAEISERTPPTSFLMEVVLYNTDPPKYPLAAACWRVNVICAGISAAV
jgi:hypothetical protein